jgi:hypothetical protein
MGIKNQNRTCKKCRNQKMNGWFGETIRENGKKNTNNKYGREDEKSKMTRKSQRKRKRGRAEQSWI